MWANIKHQIEYGFFMKPITVNFYTRHNNFTTTMWDKLEAKGLVVTGAQMKRYSGNAAFKTQAILNTILSAN